MNVIDLASSLIRIPSVNPNSMANRDDTCGEQILGDYVAGILKSMGANVAVTYPFPERPNVFGYFDCGAKSTIIFDVHLDTVPVTGMTTSPFSGEVVDGKLYGRGSSDVKGPMAAMLCALDNALTNKTLKYNMLFVADCDEEAGFGGVKHFTSHFEEISKLLQTDIPPVAFVIVAEPTEFRPVIGHKGAVRWKVRTDGVAAHSSTPHLGKNAIYEMAKVIGILEQYAEKLAGCIPNEQFGVPALSVGIIEGGSAANIVPDFCEIQVDRRLVPGETPEGASLDMKVLLDSQQATVSLPTLSAPVLNSDSSHPLVKNFINLASQFSENSHPIYANYCTNGSFYSNLEVPVIVFGPGSISQAHTKDEWILAEDLTRGVNAYYTVITQL